MYKGKPKKEKGAAIATGLPTKKSLVIKFGRKEGHHVFIKGPVNQEHIIVLMQLYAPTNTALKYRNKR